MNAECLLQHYERIADAPGAIARLRLFIFDMAVRGKLVPQEPKDGSQAKVLVQARRELRVQAEAAKRMRWQETEPVSPGDIEKDVPSGWVAARVNDTGLYINGLAFKPSDWKSSGTPIIRIQNLTDPKKEFNYAEGPFPDEVIVRKGDLLVSWSATLEAFRWDRNAGVLNQHIFRVIPHEGLTDRDFLLLLLRHAIREMADSEHAHGLVMTHINRGPFLNHIVLIPPLAEQQRIVTKIDELMGLCDRLEAAREAREVTRDRLAAASLARLNVPDPETFQDDARFVLKALPALTTRPDQIKRLRQTILNLAVRGKLVPQDPDDEPASQLLKRIAEEKMRLLSANNTRAKQAIPRDSKTDAFALPLNWAWCQLDEVAWKITDGDHLTPKREANGRYLLSARNVLNGRIDLSDVDFVGNAEFDRMRGRCDPNKFDLLISCSGSVGRVAIVDQDDAYVMVRSAALVKPVFASEMADYLAKALIADCLQDQMGIRSKAAAQPNLFIGPIRQLMVPLPPLAEQRRIVAKVDELTRICDRLEASLTGTAAIRRCLLDALLAEALAPVDAREMEAAE